jgi:CheY-like chemotaxis protein
MGRKILIVEDDAAVRMLARSILEEEGHEVIEADGLAVQPAARPDLVLFDIGFGFEALVQVVADGVPVLVLTAWAVPELVAAAEDLGARGHVQKPFDCGELRERVAAALPAQPAVAAAA